MLGLLGYRYVCVTMCIVEKNLRYQTTFSPIILPVIPNCKFRNVSNESYFDPSKNSKSSTISINKKDRFQLFLVASNFLYVMLKVKNSNIIPGLLIWQENKLLLFHQDFCGGTQRTLG